MTWVEAASIAAGLGIGYWLVSVFTRASGEDDAEICMPPLEPEGEFNGERPWHEVLDVSEWTSDEEVAVAYRAKATQYHPDKVATMGPEIRALAALKMAEVNAAVRDARRRR